jgi:glutamyl-tRNA synthetase
MRVPEGVTSFVDAVRGEISINNREVDDQVLMKSDGFPTYHLAVVVDDALMKITHVLRGEEWLPSTPKQIMLYHMFGWEAPVFAHIPLLLNPDKKKLSKRQGDVAVEDFLAKGYLPQALLNFVATLGFNPSADREIYTMEELAQLFDLGRVNSAGAVLNLEKLDWFNRHYLRELGEGEYLAWAQRFGVDTAKAPAARAALVERSRINRFDELSPAVEQYFATQLEGAELLTWKKSDAADAKTQLTAAHAFLSDWPEEQFAEVNAIDGALRAWIVERGVQPGNALWPLRVALSGREKSASPFEYLYVLGKEVSLARIQHAISLL